MKRFEDNTKKTMAQTSSDYSSEHGGESTLQPTETIALGAPELDNASKLLKDFLLKNSAEFVRVNKYREKVVLVPILSYTPS